MKKIWIVILVLFLVACSRSPKQIFQALFGKVRESVQIIHGQDQEIFDCCLWLHFKISESDFNQLFNDYSPEKLNYGKWSGVTPYGVNWWHPQIFKEEGLYFEHKSEDERLIEGVYTNSKKTEVFYVNWYN